jgi:hypothetical protein
MSQVALTISCIIEHRRRGRHGVIGGFGCQTSRLPDICGSRHAVAVVVLSIRSFCMLGAPVHFVDRLHVPQAVQQDWSAKNIAGFEIQVLEDGVY